MSLMAVDVALTLPPPQRELAVAVSGECVERLAAHGQRSRFQLGQPFPGEPAQLPAAEPTGSSAGEQAPPCEPHVSLFMLAVDVDDLARLVAALGAACASLPAIRAEGGWYRHNPYGAPELFFHRGAQWFDLQAAVIAVSEPLRRGRLRDVDPAGVALADLVASLRRTEPTGPRLAQLLRYGYDEVTDADADRFHPHVTFAWPVDPAHRVDLAGLPPAEAFSCTLSRLGVFAMPGAGTCTRRYGEFVLPPVGQDSTTAVVPNSQLRQ